MSYQPPVFVVAPARSGTTVLSHMLASHLELACSPETNVMGILHQIARRDPTMTFAQFQRRQLEFLMHGHNRNYSALVFPKLMERRIAECPREFCEFIIGLDHYSDGRSVLEQTPRNGEHLCALRWLFPEAIILFVLRNPFDVIQSNMATPWGTRNPVLLFMLWARQYAELVRLYRTYGRSGTMIVRYERLECEGYRTGLIDRLQRCGIARRPRPLQIKPENFAANDWASRHLSQSTGEFHRVARARWTERHAELRRLGDAVMRDVLRAARGAHPPGCGSRLVQIAAKLLQRTNRR